MRRINHALADGLEKRVLRGLPGITAFALDGSRWGFKHLQQLLVWGKGCTSLQSLNISLRDNSASHVDVVAAYLASPNSAHLRELSLEADDHHALDSVVNELGQGHRLTSLRLVDGTIGGDALQSLADGVAQNGALKELQELSLIRVDGGQEGWVGLFEAVGRSHGWSNVRKLCLECWDEDALFEAFASSVKHGAFTALQDLQLLLCRDVAPLAEAFKHNQLLARGLRRADIVASYDGDTGFISDWAKAFEVDGQFVDGLKRLCLCVVDCVEQWSPRKADMQALAALLVTGFGRHLEEVRLPIRASTARALCDGLLACAWTELKELELDCCGSSANDEVDEDADEDGHWDVNAVEALACLLGGRCVPVGGHETVEGQSKARATRALTTFDVDAAIIGHDNVPVLLDALAAPRGVRLQTLQLSQWPNDRRLWDHALKVLTGDAGNNLQTITIDDAGVPADYADWLLGIATAIRADKKVLPELASIAFLRENLGDSARAAHASLHSLLESRSLMG